MQLNRKIPQRYDSLWVTTMTNRSAQYINMRVPPIWNQVVSDISHSTRAQTHQIHNLPGTGGSVCYEVEAVGENLS